MSSGTTLHVEVHLHGALVRHVPDAQRGVVRRELSAGARVGDILASFSFPADRRVIVGVDGQTANLDDPVTDGARIDLVPPISGGARVESDGLQGLTQRMKGLAD